MNDDPCLKCELPDCDDDDERCFYFVPLVQIEREPTRREMVKAMVTERLKASKLKGETHEMVC
jgi:hypothetical protein